MKPVYQKRLHLPRLNLYGDCMSACIASILEINTEDVPHFAGKYFNEPDKFHKAIRDWLAQFGYFYLTILYGNDPRNEMKQNNSGIYYIFSGESGYSRASHSVICINDKIVHDPAEEDRQIDDIVGPLPNGYYQVHFIGTPRSLNRRRFIRGKNKSAKGL